MSGQVPADVPVGISVAYLAPDISPPALSAVLDRVHDSLLLSDPWAGWLSQHLGPDAGLVMHVEERETLRRLVRRDGASLFVPAAELEHDPELLAEQMRGILVDFLRDIAAKRGLPDPPE